LRRGCSARDESTKAFAPAICADCDLATGNELELIVQPFERGRHPSSLAQEGTGIGLPLAKSLVEMHGGRLTITSILNVGTEVTVHLPSWRDRDAENEDEWLPGIGPRSAAT
jgi:signal transduction histidine kinase